jgi:cob(I)alamin adenosyltransferase
MAFKIYTKTGDQGETGLFGGARVAKSHLRVEAYGTLDELNSFVGWLRDSLTNAEEVDVVLEQVQHRLFTIGSNLAADPDKHPPVPDLELGDVTLLESSIDAMDAALPPLKNFILPGGHPTVSLCHVCRTVCRRAERLVVAVHHVTPLAPIILHYLNRLSDYFFVLGRHLGHQLGAQEVVWKPR